VIDVSSIPRCRVEWQRATRIIRSLYPPIDLFEDIADPEDWALLISAEQKTNPRVMETIGNIDLVPPARRVRGPGASYLMAPFTHISTDRPNRFSNGSYGILYVGKTFETALFETMYHHARFMRATAQQPGWASQFREIILDIDALSHDIRSIDGNSAFLSPDDYSKSQTLGAALRALGSSEVILYPSVRQPGGECVGLFYPNCASSANQGRHLDYHWNGTAVDFYREAGSRRIFRVV
jgi:hypothetical protein